MGELEYFIECTIKCNPDKMTLNISQPHLISKITQVFNINVKSFMTLNVSDTSHKGVVCNQETYTNISYNIQKRYSSGLGYLI